MDPQLKRALMRHVFYSTLVILAIAALIAVKFLLGDIHW